MLKTAFTNEFSYKAKEEHCLHCHKTLNNDKVEEFFCCKGCYGVYHFLISNDLDKYYDLMKKFGEEPISVIDQSDPHSIIFRDKMFNSIFKLSNKKWGFFVPDVRCAACIWLIEKILSKNKNIIEVEVSLVHKTVSFNFVKQEDNSLEEVARILIQGGYNVLPLPFSSSREFRSNYEKERLKDIAISGFAFGNIMIFALSSYFGSYFGIDASMNKLFNLLSMLIALPTVIYSGRTFFVNSLKAFSCKKIHIDMTISFALLTCLFVSIYQTFIGSDRVYYDSITGLIFLLLIGRYAHEKSLYRAKELGESVKNILPMEAYSIVKGDEFIVPKGNNFLADGIIIEGETEVNEAALTGEEQPVVKRTFDFVLAGSQNLLNPVKIKAEKTGYETWIASLERLIESARLKKSKTELQIEKILPIFTFFIISTSILSAFVWFFISPSQALNVFVSVLIVSCPCALALATPLTMSYALKTMWDKGVIIKNSDAIEALSEIDTVVFDKTGTLTDGNLSVISHKILSKQIISEDFENKILTTFALVSKNSLHLVSKALVKKYLRFENTSFFNVTDVKEYAGKGLSAFIQENSIEIKIGKQDFVGILSDVKEENYFTVFAKFGEYEFEFILSESLQEGAMNLISYLNEKNIESFIFSGDKYLSVKNIAKKINIQYKNIKAPLLPEEKLNLLEQLQLGFYESNVVKKRKVLAIGDGVNDAAMLAKAHVSIAAHGGVDIALHSADIFLRKPEMDLVQKTIQYCFYIKNTLNILIITSLVYNLIVIIFAILGFVSPLIAALFMPISSLSVYLIVIFRTGFKIWSS